MESVVLELILGTIKCPLQIATPDFSGIAKPSPLKVTRVRMAHEYRVGAGGTLSHAPRACILAPLSHSSQKRTYEMFNV